MRCVKKLANLAAIAVFGIALMPSPSVADTEAEIAAMTERPLTAEEVARQREECRLPDVSAPTSIEGDEFGDVLEWPAQQFLLIALPSATSSNLANLPNLPKGGIGGRDICEVTFLHFLPGAESPFNVAVALRLRPNVDLADYPTAKAAIDENGRLITTTAKRYRVGRFFQQSNIPTFLFLHGVEEDADKRAPSLVMGDQKAVNSFYVFVPLEN